VLYKALQDHWLTFLSELESAAESPALLRSWCRSRGIFATSEQFRRSQRPVATRGGGRAGLSHVGGANGAAPVAPMEPRRGRQ
jgi:hypothetical protein